MTKPAELIDRMQRAAEQATQGQWETDNAEDGEDHYVTLPGFTNMIAEMRGTGGGISYEQQGKNCRHIAIMNPENTLLLIHAYRAAVELLRELKKSKHSMGIEEN